MTESARSAAGRPRERDLLVVAARHLETEGYRTYLDIDGTDYFDLVAKRGQEVGLIEGKISGSQRVLVQALRRRAWGDWVAVVLASPRSAEALVRRTQSGRASPVGVWTVVREELSILRPATPWSTRTEDDPFRELKNRFRRVLESVDRGELPAGARWSDVNREVRRAAGGRGFAEWRLDENASNSG
ncbi:MAG: hypothetical protein ACLQD9_00445 [Thermoplasmata archaeon]